jgi:hypothetical protein
MTIRLAVSKVVEIDTAFGDRLLNIMSILRTDDLCCLDGPFLERFGRTD